mmetsp:Transcript_9573/g.39092  ORF Transcript_9573/g.39092 Transcript_9573/m.39092 type:complete len:532 (-) Transcript_9573:167-1762(-)
MPWSLASSGDPPGTPFSGGGIVAKLLSLGTPPPATTGGARGAPVVVSSSPSSSSSPGASPAVTSTARTPPRSEVTSKDDEAASVAASLVALAVTYGLAWLAWRLSKRIIAAVESALRAHTTSTLPAPAAAWLAKRYGANPAAWPGLTEHERTIASCVVDPSALGCAGLADVGGLDAVVDELRDLVVLPLARPDLFGGLSSQGSQSAAPPEKGGKKKKKKSGSMDVTPSGSSSSSSRKLIRAPRGVLLYGPPGTGKTLVARAVAVDAGAALLDVRAATLSDKYYGETNKLCAAMFSLAAKLAPCVIFLDEVDGFLSARSSRDHDVTLALKAQFFTCLDGLIADPRSTSVVVLAATNRPFDLDPAALRRLARQFEIGLPGLAARRHILDLLLRGAGPLAADVSLDDLARRTRGFSGSDLEELCRAAATRPVREFAKRQLSQLREESSEGAAVKAPPATGEPPQPRPIGRDDFADALRRVRPTGEDSRAYRRATAAGEVPSMPPVDPNTAAEAFFAAAAKASATGDADAAPEID